MGKRFSAENTSLLQDEFVKEDERDDEGDDESALLR
jgi:hypothetical protein